MKFIGNIFWLLLGGILICLYYYIVGILFCITLIGIPFGIQLFKIGTFALWPFGRECVDGAGSTGCLSIFMNILWILIGGIEIAMTHVVLGLILCITIIGIPFGLQHFKLAILAIIPFGRQVVSSC